MLLALQFQLSTFRKHNVYFHSALRFHCISCCTALLFSLLPCNLQKLSCVLAEFDTYVSPGSLILYTSPLNIRISSSNNTRNDFSVNTGKTEVTFKGLIPSPSSLEHVSEKIPFVLLEVVCISVSVQTKVLLSLQFLRWGHPLSAFLN